MSGKTDNSIEKVMISRYRWEALESAMVAIVAPDYTPDAEDLARLREQWKRAQGSVKTAQGGSLNGMIRNTIVQYIGASPSDQQEILDWALAQVDCWVEEFGPIGAYHKALTEIPEIEDESGWNGPSLPSYRKVRAMMLARI